VYEVEQVQPLSTAAEEKESSCLALAKEDADGASTLTTWGKEEKSEPPSWGSLELSATKRLEKNKAWIICWIDAARRTTMFRTGKNTKRRSRTISRRRETAQGLTKSS